MRWACYTELNVVNKLASILVCVVLLVMQVMCSCAAMAGSVAGARDDAKAHACCANKPPVTPVDETHCPHCDGTSRLNLVQGDVPVGMDALAGAIPPAVMMDWVSPLLGAPAIAVCRAAEWRVGESPPVRLVCCVYLI